MQLCMNLYIAIELRYQCSENILIGTDIENTFFENRFTHGSKQNRYSIYS